MQTEAIQSSLVEIIDKLITWGVDMGGRLVAALAIFIVGRFIINLVKKALNTVLSKRHVDAGIQSFVKSLVNILLIVLLAIAVIGKLGVETTSFAALLAGAGMAISMALSGNLSNFAGGLIVLLFRPFKVGDFVEYAGIAGVVTEIQIFHTIITTGDNRVVFVPNGQISNNMVMNYSREKTRRVDLTVGVEYGEDYNHVESVVKQILAEDHRILQTPAPFVALHALADSSVNIVIRVWVKSPDYWDVYFNLNKTIYTTFNRQGIGFPFPQLTIHNAASLQDNR